MKETQFLTPDLLKSLRTMKTIEQDHFSKMAEQQRELLNSYCQVPDVREAVMVAQNQAADILKEQRERLQQCLQPAVSIKDLIRAISVLP